jgi:hypothetical protein
MGDMGEGKNAHRRVMTGGRLLYGRRGLRDEAGESEHKPLAAIGVTAGVALVAGAIAAAAGADLGLVALIVAVLVVLAAIFAFFHAELGSALTWIRANYPAVAAVFVGLVLILGAGVGAWFLMEPAVNGGKSTSCKLDPPPSSKSVIRGKGVTAKDRWRLTRLGSGKGSVRIDLSDYAGTRRVGTGGVGVVPLKKNSSRRLPASTVVTAYVRQGGLTSSDGSLGLPVRVDASRQPDGEGIAVCASVKRPGERNAVEPGRYEGTIRVGGAAIQGTDLPMVLTIKGSRIETAAVALLVALLGIAVAATSTRPESDELDGQQMEAAIDADKKKHQGLAVLPAIGGLIAGLAAALIVYEADPVWGADRGKDFLELITATFAAASVGLTAAVPPAKAARKRIAKKRVAEDGTIVARQPKD